MQSGRTSTTRRSQAPSQASSVVGQDLVTDMILRQVGPPVMCDHQMTTKLFICRKQGPNYKRLFWRCPMSRDQQCSTFVWCQIQPPLPGPLLPGERDRAGQCDRGVKPEDRANVQCPSGGSEKMQTPKDQQERNQPLSEEGGVHHLRQGTSPGEDSAGDPEGAGAGQTKTTAQLPGVSGMEKIGCTGAGRQLDRQWPKPGIRVTSPIEGDGPECKESLKNKGVKHVLITQAVVHALVPMLFHCPILVQYLIKISIY